MSASRRGPASQPTIRTGCPIPDVETDGAVRRSPKSNTGQTRDWSAKVGRHPMQCATSIRAVFGLVDDVHPGSFSQAKVRSPPIRTAPVRRHVRVGPRLERGAETTKVKLYTRRSRTWYTGVPHRVFYVFNFVKLRLAVRCRARQGIRLHKHGRAGSCRQTQLSLKVGFLDSLREV